MIKYRILNREEAEELGPDWRSVLGWNYAGEMDYLLGRELSYQEVRPLLAGRSYTSIDGWSIVKSNIKPIEESIIPGVEVKLNGLFKT